MSKTFQVTYQTHLVYRFLKQQMQQQQLIMGKNEKLRRLKEKAEAQEAKLKKIRLLCGKAEHQKLVFCYVFILYCLK